MSNRSTEESDRRGSYTSGSSRKRSRTRSRSRSPYSKEFSRKSKEYSPCRDKIKNNEYERNKRLDCDSKRDKSKTSMDLRLTPPPPRISKLSPKLSKTAGIQMKLNPVNKPEPTKKISVASAFANDDSDDEVEEMPAECRMRMRNIGRETPTSSGPNSFGKTKHGFCDSKKIFERNLKNVADES